MGEAMTAQWHVVLTRPRQELRAALNLSGQGGEVFLPMLRAERIVRGKRCLVDEVLFPGYLFLKTGTAGGLYGRVRSTYGVRGFLRFAEQPVVVADAIVEDIRRRIAVPQTAEVLQKGDRVQLTDGPFRDYEAIFQGYSGEERAVVLVRLLGQQNRLVIDLEQLCKA